MNTRWCALFTVSAALAVAVSGCGHSAGGAAAVPPLAMTAAGDARSAEGQSSAVPGERLNALPGLPVTGSASERLNALPGQPKPLCTMPVKGSGSVGCPVQSRADLAPQTNPQTPYAQILGFKPHDLASAYAIPAGPGTGRTVAVVDAFDDPAAESDLAVYRAAMGLPACTTANGCFSKVVAHNGNSTKADAGWSAEVALDIEMVSAVCPQCRILLVEAKSDKMKDLAAAVDVAASYHPDAISNSYFAPDGGAGSKFAASFDHPGIAITAASGDNGYGPTFPASLATVVAVGGTSLLPDATVSRNWDEGVWSGSGSGCSLTVAKPVWQTDRGCTGRTIADVGVVADPRTGVAMYTSIAAPGQVTGWIVGGGTSVGAPVIAALYALAGNAATITAPRRLWTSRAALWPVINGSNGTCTIAYLCGASAAAAYSGPAGNGTPNGLNAF